MSFEEEGRKLHPETANNLLRGAKPMSGIAVDTPTFIQTIADALERSFGSEPSAIKRAAHAARAGIGTAKNWFDRKNAPSGKHLVTLMGVDDNVYAAVMKLSGRGDVAERAELAEAIARLAHIVESGGAGT